MDKQLEVSLIEKFDADGMKALKESLQYILDSEKIHYDQWIERPWCKPEEHIYHSATIALNWFTKRVE